jgi:hypothetical protein
LVSRLKSQSNSSGPAKAIVQNLKSPYSLNITYFSWNVFQFIVYSWKFGCGNVYVITTSGGNEEAINNNENSLFFEAKNIQQLTICRKFI